MRPCLGLVVAGWLGLQVAPGCGGNTCAEGADCGQSGTGDGGSTSQASEPTTTGAATSSTGGVESRWCADVDGDGFGDPANCGSDMSPGSVPNDDDCDDGDPSTFPGAAPGDGADACMTDADGDEFGDDDPGPGVTPGSDCADDDQTIHEGCPCEAGEARCVGDDLHVCDGKGGESVTACEFGCDAALEDCRAPLVVDAGPSVCVAPGQPAQLGATASGGDGLYSYQWTPADGLDDPASAGPKATVDGPSSYAVAVSDGAGNQASDSVSVFVADQALSLDPKVCTQLDFPHEDSNADPAAVWAWSEADRRLCQTVNAKGSAVHCDWELDDATIRGTLSVGAVEDDDWIGILWGIQDSSHFYVFSWKQLDQVAGSCGNVMTYAGMQVKVVDVLNEEVAPLKCRDLLEPSDTLNSRLLVSVDEFTKTGWLDNVEYSFALTHRASGETTIAVRRADDDSLVAEKTFTDTTYPKGKFGVYVKSQIGACFADFSVACER